MSLDVTFMILFVTLLYRFFLCSSTKMSIYKFESYSILIDRKSNSKIEFVSLFMLKCLFIFLWTINIQNDEFHHCRQQKCFHEKKNEKSNRQKFHFKNFVIQIKFEFLSQFHAKNSEHQFVILFISWFATLFLSQTNHLIN